MTALEAKETTMPLEGLNILDLGTMTPGKYCTLLLADLGADVIRIERSSAAGSPISEEDLILNRNKKSIALNLKIEEGRRIFYQLAEKADVILESNRPGAAKRMGVDYDTIKGINPGIIYCSLTGFGQDGPYSSLPAFDMIFMAIGGLLGLLAGKNQVPVVPGIYVSDAGSGLMATIGILTALVARSKTKKGRFVDIAMLDGVISILSTVSGFLRPNGEPAQSETLGLKMPGYSVYETKDEKYVALGIFRPQSWQALCRFFGREDLINRQWSTGQAQEEIFSVFKKKFLTKTRDEWCQTLRKLDIEIGPVNDLKEVYDDPQVQHRQMAVHVEHPEGGKMKQIGIPIKLSETPEPVIKPAPAIGRDTEEILKTLNYNKAQIQELRSVQAI